LIINTRQKAEMIAKHPLIITHSPGYMFVEGLRDSEFKRS